MHKHIKTFRAHTTTVELDNIITTPLYKLKLLNTAISSHCGCNSVVADLYLCIESVLVSREFDSRLLTTWRAQVCYSQIGGIPRVILLSPQNRVNHINITKIQYNRP